MAVGKGIFPPENPEDGALFTVAGMEFVWVAAANRWLRKATGEMILPALLRVIATMADLDARTRQLYPPLVLATLTDEAGNRLIDGSGNPLTGYL